MFFDFFTLAVFQNKSKKFWRLTENPENIFRTCDKFSGNFFRENPYTLSPAKQNYLQLPKKPVKTQILRREFDSGLPRAFAARFCR